MNHSLSKSGIKLLLTFLMVVETVVSRAQQSSLVKYEIEAQAIGTTNNVVPFWMRSNQYGSVPSDGISGSFIGRAHKGYDSTKTGLFDWGAGLEGRVNAGKESKLFLIEGYAKVKAGIFQLKVGRTKDVMGFNGDTSLSSGNFSISGNALGVPKVDVSIPEYWSVPIWNGLFSFKGNFVHGWLGTLNIYPNAGLKNIIEERHDTVQAHSYFHQLSLYGRLGRQNSRLKLYGGFNHNVFWGNERKVQGNGFKLSNIETFFYVMTGKTYGNDSIPTTKIGNQLGSIDIALQYAFEGVILTIYRQSIYDVGALAKLANIRDGLNGVTFENKQFGFTNRPFQWKTLLLEFLYTKHQAGEIGSKHTNSGDEDYYNNYYYIKGWSYYANGLGTPFISPKHSTREGLASANGYQYFNNNRVIALHLGLEGKINEWNFTAKSSYSINYGTFLTSNDGLSSPGIGTPTPNTNLFGKIKEFSAYIEASRKLNKGYTLGYAASIDQGKLLNNSLGVVLKLSKSF